jgi:hypothetical protein
MERVTVTKELITYVDSSDAEWQDFRPGSRRKLLYENPETGQLTMLVQWDAGYRMGAIEHHERDKQAAATPLHADRGNGRASCCLRVALARQYSEPAGVSTR